MNLENADTVIIPEGEVVRIIIDGAVVWEREP